MNDSEQTAAVTPATPVRTVTAFLAAMQARDLATAEGFLHADFEMVFPGNARFTKLTELVNWAQPRYRNVGKNIERCEQVSDGGHPVVWCFGTLYGEWPDGKSFDGIRFVDRFELRGSLLFRQQVWNDLAEVRAEQQTDRAN